MEYILFNDIKCKCSETIEKVKFFTESKKKEVDFILAQKCKKLEYYCNKLTLRKENLEDKMKLLAPFENKILQLKSSLEHPRQVAIQCLKIRKNRTGEDLFCDDVDIEIKSELKLIEDSQIFLENLLINVTEQLRKYKAIIYALKRDLQNKSSALEIDKNNMNLNIRDLCYSNENEDLNYSFIMHSDEIFYNWEDNTKKILENAKIELHAGQKLKIYAEESLKKRRQELITQFNQCNKIFEKRLTEYKEKSSSLKNKCLQVDEQIKELKQIIENLENTIIAENPHKELTEVRLNRRLDSLYSELIRDNVENELIEALKMFQTNTANLKSKKILAKSALQHCNKLKSYFKHEIEVKENSINIDEKECLGLRSTIHILDE